MAVVGTLPKGRNATSAAVVGEEADARGQVQCYVEHTLYYRALCCMALLCCDVCVWQLKIEMASQAPPKEAGSGKGGKGILSLRKRLRRRKGQRIRQRRRRRLRWRHAFLANVPRWERAEVGSMRRSPFLGR